MEISKVTVNIPEDWPEWPKDGLEYLGKCPVCGSADRTLLHENLIDRWFHAPGRWTMYLCGSCAAGYLDPRPNQATIGLAYANYLTHQSEAANASSDNRLALRLRNGYLNTKYGYHMAPASRLGYLVMNLLPPPLRLEWDHYARHLSKPRPGHNKLLDVGCGNGEFLARARWQGWDVHGIDFDDVALSRARATGIPVVQGAIEPSAFPSSSFDVITSHQVLEHVHSPIAFLKTLFTWLKPGGTVWLGTPNIASTLHSAFGADWYCLHPPHHLTIFSAQSLITTMSSCGFTKAKLIPRGYLDSHIYRQSENMRSTSDVGNWHSFTHGREHTLTLARQATTEVSTWLHPSRGSDLVAIGRKPGS